jgi:hypothetical protein
VSWHTFSIACPVVDRERVIEKVLSFSFVVRIEEDVEGIRYTVDAEKLAVMEFDPHRAARMIENDVAALLG